MILFLENALMMIKRRARARASVVARLRNQINQSRPGGIIAFL